VRVTGGHVAWSESFSEMFAPAAGVFGNAAASRLGRARRHGRAGRVENCQVEVFLAYAAPERGLVRRADRGEQQPCHQRRLDAEAGLEPGLMPAEFAPMPRLADRNASPVCTRAVMQRPVHTTASGWLGPQESLDVEVDVDPVANDDLGAVSG